MVPDTIASFGESLDEIAIPQPRILVRALPGPIWSQHWRKASIKHEEYRQYEQKWKSDLRELDRGSVARCQRATKRQAGPIMVPRSFGRTKIHRIRSQWAKRHEIRR